MRTDSEAAFEQYLGRQGLRWARIPESDRKQPDYKLQHGVTTCLFEVKEFDEPSIKPSGGFSPCPPIREKIRRAAEQFRAHKDCCCTLVLWSTSVYRTVQPEVVLSAAFGEYVAVERSPLGANPNIYRLSGKAELRPDCNTTFSAITVLAPYRLNHLWVEVWRKLDEKRRKGEEIDVSEQFELLQELSPDGGTTYSYEGTIRAVTIENPYARVPFPPDLFTGPFDQRWRASSGWFRLAFMGSELDKLKRDGVPFIYL